MKILSFIVLLAFYPVGAAYSAQLVLKEETGAHLYVCLKESKGSYKAHYPLENMEEWDKGIARWKNLQEGSYRICLQQTHGSFADYWIVVSDLTISKGVNSKSIRLPFCSNLKLELKLQDITPPRKEPMFYPIWFRVNRIEKSGHPDPVYVQWLSTDLKNGIYAGNLGHLTTGTYRIAAFHNDVYPKSHDLGYGFIEVTEDVLKGGKVSTVIIKPVEQE